MNRAWGADLSGCVGRRAPTARMPLRLRARVHIDNLLVRIHCRIVMIKWPGLAPWEFEFPFPGSLAFTSLQREPLDFNVDTREAMCTQ